MFSLKPVYESSLFALGNEFVAGADEVGRGALAGPLVAAVVVFDQKSLRQFCRAIAGPIRDSKQLSYLQRERVFPFIKKYACEISVGRVSHREIDKNGMGFAAKEVFYRAIEKCRMKNPPRRQAGVKCKILVDAVRLPRLAVPHESIIHGDSKIFSIAVASIYAKVLRDRLMQKYALRYQGYGFERNVGYGTAEHFSAIASQGFCRIHRRTFCLGHLPNRL